MLSLLSTPLVSDVHSVEFIEAMRAEITKNAQEGSPGAALSANKIWKRYNSKNAKFSVLFPVKPIANRRDDECKGNQIVYDCYSVRVVVAEPFMMFNSDYRFVREDFDMSEMVDYIYSNLPEMYLQVEMELVSKRRSGYSDHQIIEVKTRGQDLEMLGRTHYVGNRVIETGIMYEPGADVGKYVNKFMESIIIE